jgi:microcystin-dependent protein
MDKNTKILLVVVAVLVVLVLLHNRNNKTEGFQDEVATSADFIIDNVEFKSDNNLIKTTVMPVGSIISWYGDITKLPTGWVKCDGTNDTPDLRGRTVVGVGQYSAEENGKTQDKFFAFKEKSGEMEHALSEEEMPSHGHDIYRSQYQGNDHSPSSTTFYALTASNTGGQGANYYKGQTLPFPYVKHTGGRVVKDADGNPMKDADGNTMYETVPHNNMQPYFALHYIMYKGV